MSVFHGLDSVCPSMCMHTKTILMVLKQRQCESFGDVVESDGAGHRGERERRTTSSVLGVAQFRGATKCT